MREIKWDTPYFKVWDGVKFWERLVKPVNGIDEMYCGDVQDLIFLIPTGLKDKNGVYIFQGDILEIGYNRLGNVQVKFENGKFNISNYKISECTIIGNIYENKELLGDN